MFRLMKLIAYALFGYALYEFVRGMSGQMDGGGGFGGGGGMGQGQRSFGGGMGQSEAFGQGGSNVSGAGEGREEATQDMSGASTRHMVGRGVIS